MAANGPSPARAPGTSRPGTSSQNSPITPVRIFGTRSGIGFSEQLPYRPLGPPDDQIAAAVLGAGWSPTSPVPRRFAFFGPLPFQLGPLTLQVTVFDADRHLLLLKDG